MSEEARRRLAAGTEKLDCLKAIARPLPREATLARASQHRAVRTATVFVSGRSLLPFCELSKSRSRKAEKVDPGFRSRSIL